MDMKAILSNFELTRDMIDGPRQFLALYQGAHRVVKTAEMRDHLELSGCNIDNWPDWARGEDTEITKSGAAILIWHMMIDRAPDSVRTSVDDLVEAKNLEICMLQEQLKKTSALLEAATTALELNERRTARNKRLSIPSCKTCNDNGAIGGPSFSNPDEGGVQCPDCGPLPVAEVLKIELGKGEIILKEGENDEDSVELLLFRKKEGSPVVEPGYVSSTLKEYMQEQPALKLRIDRQGLGLDALCKMFFKVAGIPIYYIEAH